MRVLLAFASADLRNIGRDSMLLALLFVPWLMLILPRLALPVLGGWISAQFSLTITDLTPLILSLFFVLQIPMLFGLVFGLLVLDERDAGTLMALLVTPISSNTYLLYRVGLSALIAAFYVVLTVTLSGLAPAIPLLVLLPIALLAGLFGPFVALLLAAVAKNKVEGLALSKAFSILMIGPLAGYFIDGPWQLLLGILPSYWPAKALWVTLAGGNAWPYLFAGLVWNVCLLIALVRIFKARVYR